MLWKFGQKTKRFTKAMQETAHAVADMGGDKKHPDIRGTVSFYESAKGVLVVAEIFGLPHNTDTHCGGMILGFHIHEGKACSGNDQDPFADAGMHYNPYNCPHPQHAGDMPPLFSNNGYAWMAFYTERFTINEVMGRAVIIHSRPDDFVSQPSGNSGEKIACGIINKAFK